MKQVSHRGYLLVEVPEDAKLIRIGSDPDRIKGKCLYANCVSHKNPVLNQEGLWWSDNLPPGQWEIIGKGNEIKEQVCKGIVQYDIHPMEDYVIGYTDYNLDDDNVLLDTAKKSLDSLIKSHGMKPSETLILKLKTNE